MFTCTDRPSATSELSLSIFSSAPAAFQRHGSVLRIKAEEQSSHCFHRHEADCLGWKWFRVAVMKKNVKNELKRKQAVCKVYTECFSGENYMLSDKTRLLKLLKIYGLTLCSMMDQLTHTHSLSWPQISKSMQRYNWSLNVTCFCILHQVSFTIS